MTIIRKIKNLRSFLLTKFSVLNNEKDILSIKKLEVLVHESQMKEDMYVRSTIYQIIRLLTTKINELIFSHKIK